MGARGSWVVAAACAAAVLLGARAPFPYAAAGTQRSASVNPASGTVAVSGSHSGGSGSGSGGGGSGSGGSSSSGASADDEVVLPDPHTTTTPRARGVVGFPTVAEVTVPPVRDPHVDTPEGTDVVQLRVTEIRVDFGDGSGAERVAVGHLPAPLRRELRHVYERPGAFRVRTALVWSAMYVPAVGPPRELGPVVTESDQQYPVVEVRTVLVR